MNELARTKQWFELAVTTPTDKNKMVQLGVHFEEVGEMFEAIGEDDQATALSRVATAFKTGVTQGVAQDVVPLTFDRLTVNRKELLDALCDQIVTSVGVAHMLGLNIVEAMARVNDSNWSKYVDNKPIFDENGKIKKGPNYKKPDLEGLY